MNLTSVNGTHTRTFTPTQPFVRVRYNASLPFSLATASLKGTHTDTTYTLLARKGGYRFSFQGQEHDDEIKGKGNSVNYTFRMHDPRIGRFFAIDPLSKGYPWNSPYAFSENDVIACVELEGAEKWLVVHYKDVNGNIEKTIVTLYNAEKAYGDMTKGIGILYMTRTADSQGNYSSEKFTFRDNNHSSFFDLPLNRWTARGMTGSNQFYDSRGKGVTTSPEQALQLGLKKTPGGYPLNEQVIRYPEWTRQWHFENDKADAFYGTQAQIDEMNDAINEIVVLLKENPGFTVTVEGHTSTPQPADKNMKLSQERADYVRNEILKRLPQGEGYEKRVTAIGYGETMPIEADDNVENPTNDPNIRAENEKKQNTNRRTIINVTNNSNY